MRTKPPLPRGRRASTPTWAGGNPPSPVQSPATRRQNPETRALCFPRLSNHSAYDLILFLTADYDSKEYVGQDHRIERIVAWMLWIRRRSTFSRKTAAPPGPNSANVSACLPPQLPTVFTSSKRAKSFAATQRLPISSLSGMDCSHLS